MGGAFKKKSSKPKEKRLAVDTSKPAEEVVAYISEENEPDFLSSMSGVSNQKSSTRRPSGALSKTLG